MLSEPVKHSIRLYRKWVRSFVRSFVRCFKTLPRHLVVEGQTDRPLTLVLFRENEFVASVCRLLNKVSAASINCAYTFQ